jgi:hypothetical protein
MAFPRQGFAVLIVWKQRLETGTGFADAKLSEILRCGRVAPFVQDDKKGDYKERVVVRAFSIGRLRRQSIVLPGLRLLFFLIRC